MFIAFVSMYTHTDFLTLLFTQYMSKEALKKEDYWIVSFYGWNYDRPWGYDGHELEEFSFLLVGEPSVRKTVQQISASLCEDVRTEHTFYQWNTKATSIARSCVHGMVRLSFKSLELLIGGMYLIRILSMVTEHGLRL